MCEVIGILLNYDDNKYFLDFIRSENFYKSTRNKTNVKNIKILIRCFKSLKNIKLEIIITCNLNNNGIANF